MTKRAELSLDRRLASSATLFYYPDKSDFPEQNASGHSVHGHPINGSRTCGNPLD